jgi:hypothetical protein
VTVSKLRASVCTAARVARLGPAACSRVEGQAQNNDASFEDFDWLMSVNFGGTVNGILTLLPRRKRASEAASYSAACCPWA